MSNTTEKQFIFVVHTNLYSGSFERELTGFITGQVGDCDVGCDMAEIFYQDVSDEVFHQFEEMIEQVIEDSGHRACYRPCAIWPTPNRGNDGVGCHGDVTDDESKKNFPYEAYESVAVFFNQQPTDNMISLMKDRSKLYEDEYGTDGFKILGYQLLGRETKTVTNEITTEYKI